jgi:hypothetical protein
MEELGKVEDVLEGVEEGLSGPWKSKKVETCQGC